jgi:hypothetical protein
MFMKPLHALSGLGLLLLAACNSNPIDSETSLNSDAIQVEQDWQNLVKDLEVKPQVFEVNASQSNVITTNTGSRIHVPASAFVDENGQVVTGQVDIIWQEYHTLADQIFSDINMVYDSAGMAYPFISGGMFSIDGAQSGRPIAIADDKSVRVELASQSEQQNFNFYIQEDGGQWRFLENSTTTVDAEAPITVASNTALIPEKYNRAGFVFDAQPKNLKDFDELAEQDIVGWQTSKKLVQREQFKIRNEISVCELARENASNYSLNFVFDDETISYPVKPYLLEDAAQETAANRILLNKKIEETETALADENVQQLVRSAEITSFATYNWDVCARMEEPITAYNNFESIDPGVNPEKLRYTLVCLTDNYQLSFNSGMGLMFDGRKKNAVLAIDATGKIFYAPPSEFVKFTKKKMDKSDFFTLIDSGVALQSVADLDDVINYLKKT